MTSTARRDAEIKELRAEIERLTAERDEGARLRRAQANPAAWLYEVATTMSPSGLSGWATRVSLLPPVVPKGCMRNLQPLFLDDGELERLEK